MGSEQGQQQQMSTARVGITLIVITCVAIIARVLWSLHIGDLPHLGDEFVYDALASNLADGKGYSVDGVHPSAYKTPGLPAVMAVLFKLFGHHLLPTRILQSLVGGVTALIAYHIATAMGHRPSTGLLAAAGVAIYPYYVYSASSVYPVVFATFFLALSALTAIQGVSRQDSWFEALSGLSFGVSLMFTAQVALAAGLVAIWVYLTKAADRRNRAVAAVLFLIMLAVPCLPWMVRNKVLLGRARFSTVFEYGFYVGNDPRARWNSGAGIMELGDPEVMRKAATLSETDAADLYMREAIKQVARDPARFVVLSMGKAINFWRPYPNLKSRPLRTYEKVVGILSYGPVLLLAIYSFAIDARRRRYNYLFLIYPLATIVPIAITCSEDRYRMPYDIYLIILASAALMSWIDGRKPQSVSE